MNTAYVIDLREGDYGKVIEFFGKIRAGLFGGGIPQWTVLGELQKTIEEEFKKTDQFDESHDPGRAIREEFEGLTLVEKVAECLRIIWRILMDLFEEFQAGWRISF